MSYTLIAAASEQPVTRAMAEAQCRLNAGDADALLDALIVAARQLAEQKTGRSFSPQTWELVMDAFPDEIALHNGPVMAVTSVKYLDASGVEQTLASDAYRVDAASLPGRIMPSASWPATGALPNAVRVRYQAGLPVDDPTLGALRLWMLLAVATWFKHAEAVSDGQLASLPRTYVDGLLDEYKVYA